MSTFEKFSHPEHGNEYVKVGFSFPAVIMSVTWLAFRKLWLVCLAAVAALVAVFVFTASLMPPSEVYETPINWYFLAILAVFGIVLGFFGNRLVAARLRRKGYESVGTIETDSITNIEDAVTWP